MPILVQRYTQVRAVYNKTRKMTLQINFSFHIALPILKNNSFDVLHTPTMDGCDSLGLSECDGRVYIC